MEMPLCYGDTAYDFITVIPLMTSYIISLVCDSQTLFCLRRRHLPSGLVPYPPDLVLPGELGRGR